MKAEFYDQLAPFYHLVFEDWDKSIARQAKQLAEIIRSEGKGLGPGITIFTITSENLTIILVRPIHHLFWFRYSAIVFAD